MLFDPQVDRGFNRQLLIIISGSHKTTTPEITKPGALR